MIENSTLSAPVGAVPVGARPPVSTLQQWWVLTVRMITPTLRNGELATQIIGSIVNVCPTCIMLGSLFWTC